MFRISVVAGTADVSVPIYVVDSTAGTPETAWDFEESGIDLWYRRVGGAEVSITEATQTVNGAHSDGGVVHISDGRGRLDLPDAACAVGVDYVEYGGTITGMVVYGGIIELTDPVNNLFQSVAIDASGHTATTRRIAGFGSFASTELVNELWWYYDSSADQWILARVTAWDTTNNDATLVRADTGGNLPTAEASVDRVARSGIYAPLAANSNGSGLTEAGGTGDHLTAIDVFSIAGVEVAGAGTSGDKWRAA